MKPGVQESGSHVMGACPGSTTLEPGVQESQSHIMGARSISQPLTK